MWRGELVRMPIRSEDSTIALSLPAVTKAKPSRSAGIEQEVIDLFDQMRNPVFRYVLSFGLPANDAEDLIQEVFLALFRHLQLGRSRSNLRGWVFRVAHNLSLKRRFANQKLRHREETGDGVADVTFDPAPSAEEQLLIREREMSLRAVLRALPEQDQHCLRLRAEGLRYREIAEVLGISLGAVSISLTRSLTRLERANRR
jgi:RNA polymerase sigma-70 factor (ECF subfamily)